MRAVSYLRSGEVAVVDAPSPEIGAPDEALVRVRVSGICGSDLHIYHGAVGVEEGDQPAAFVASASSQAIL